MGGGDDEDGGRVSRSLIAQGGREVKKGEKAMKGLKDKLATLLSEVETLVEVAEKEDRNLTDDEQATYDEKMAKIDALKARIERSKRQGELKDWASEPVNEPIKPEVGTDEELEIRAGGRREASKPYKFFGEQLKDVIAAEKRDAAAIERLMNVRATGMSEGVPADGGFLVQTDFVSDLLSKVHGTGVLPSRCRKFTISSNANAVKIPYVNETSRADGSRWGGIRGYWKDEAAEKTASKPTFGRLELELNKLVGLCYLTDELLQDASMLEGFVSQGFAEEFGFKLDDAIINGTGSGQPLGIMTSGALIAVAKETGQAAATVVYENIVKMWARLWARSRPNAVWLYNQDIEPQLHTMSLAVGTGGAPVYLPAGGASASPYATLYGRPAIAIEQAQTLGTSGDIILADMSQYILADKGSMQSAASIHVKFIYDETCLRFVYRVDGQPWWQTTLTPKNGTNTVSPFVVLATRS